MTARYGTVVCSVGGTTSAECTDKGRLSGSSTLPAQTTKLGSIYITSHSVTITAGATATATGASATKTDDSASSGATNSDSTASQTSSGASSTSSGGIPRITANPGIALGGAAAAFMMAAL
ncbi:hypothetical protein VI817_009521 [Penicillium citrinum]|nr:hypothetical protein VI817_009521 [Penicillium citrinum]